MKLLLVLLFILTYHAQAEICESESPIDTTSISNLLAPGLFDFSSKYYLYYQAKNLEDLQVLKNCLDYTACRKNKESIVDDPKNYRVHIWANLTSSELASLVRSCPIKDLNKNLTVKEEDQQGSKVSLTEYAPSPTEQSALLKKSSPAFYHQPSAQVVTSTLAKLGKLLKASKLKEAEALVLFVWGIDLHGYKLKYGGVGNDVAVTNHDDKTIAYGQDWLAEPCSYIRMLRHEAEHVAQYKRSKSCDSDHNYNDHKMRERAAHLNDLRFMNSICPGASGIKLSCLERFQTKYMNLPTKK